jgi:phage terminase small subunit
MPALSKRQQMFVAEYLINGNATKSAISAGYSENGASSQGTRMLANANIAAEIAKKGSKKLAKLEITADRVLEEISKLAFLDPRKMFESDGSMKRIHEIDDDTAMAIAGFEVIELFEGTGDEKHAYGLLKKVKLVNKLGSLELLGKHLKLFSETLNVNLNITLAERISNARNRLIG